PPQVALAKGAGNLVFIRSHAKDVEKEKMFLEESADDGTVQRQEFDVETETIIDIERRFPAKSIKAIRADGKPVSSADLAKLLAAGAGLDARDENQGTLLMYFAKRGNADAVTWLLAHGADRHARNKSGKTATQLCRALPEIVRLFD